MHDCMTVQYDQYDKMVTVRLFGVRTSPVSTKVLKCTWPYSNSLETRVDVKKHVKSGSFRVILSRFYQPFCPESRLRKASAEKAFVVKLPYKKMKKMRKIQKEIM